MVQSVSGGPKLDSKFAVQSNTPQVRLDGFHFSTLSEITTCGCGNHFGEDQILGTEFGSRGSSGA